MAAVPVVGGACLLFNAEAQGRRASDEMDAGGVL